MQLRRRQNMNRTIPHCCLGQEKIGNQKSLSRFRKCSGTRHPIRKVFWNVIAQSNLWPYLHIPWLTMKLQQNCLILKIVAFLPVEGFAPSVVYKKAFDTRRARRTLI